MRLGTFTVQDQRLFGLLADNPAGSVATLAGAVEHLGTGEALPNEMLELISAGPATWAAAESVDERLSAAPLPEAGRGVWWWPVDEVKIEVPYMPPKNPWVIGANYYRHLANGYARIPKPAVAPPHVEFFSKALSSVIGHDDDIVYDKRATVTVDYECELAVVIGKFGKDIPASEAMDYIFGYTICNDVSARELQLGHRQYFRGKSLDGFSPFGPVVVSRRHMVNPYNEYIRTWVNGELRQDWIVGDMLFKIDELISVLSQGMTIEPGDVIVCGTVPGVGFEQLPQIWLQHGDVVEASITNIGVLRSTIKQVGV